MFEEIPKGRPVATDATTDGHAGSHNFEQQLIAPKQSVPKHPIATTMTLETAIQRWAEFVRDRVAASVLTEGSGAGVRQSGNRVLRVLPDDTWGDDFGPRLACRAPTALREEIEGNRVRNVPTEKGNFRKHLAPWIESVTGIAPDLTPLDPPPRFENFVPGIMSEWVSSPARDVGDETRVQDKALLRRFVVYALRMVDPEVRWAERFKDNATPLLTNEAQGLERVRAWKDLSTHTIPDPPHATVTELMAFHPTLFREYLHSIAPGVTNRKDLPREIHAVLPFLRWMHDQGLMAVKPELEIVSMRAEKAAVPAILTTDSDKDSETSRRTKRTSNGKKTRSPQEPSVDPIAPEMSIVTPEVAPNVAPEVAPIVEHDPTSDITEVPTALKQLEREPEKESRKRTHKKNIQKTESTRTGEPKNRIVKGQPKESQNNPEPERGSAPIEPRQLQQHPGVPLKVTTAEKIEPSQTTLVRVIPVTAPAPTFPVEGEVGFWGSSVSEYTFPKPRRSQLPFATLELFANSRNALVDALKEGTGLGIQQLSDLHQRDVYHDGSCVWLRVGSTIFITRNIHVLECVRPYREMVQRKVGVSSRHPDAPFFMSADGGPLLVNEDCADALLEDGPVQQFVQMRNRIIDALLREGKPFADILSITLEELCAHYEFSNDNDLGVERYAILPRVIPLLFPHGLHSLAFPGTDGGLLVADLPLDPDPQPFAHPERAPQSDSPVGNALVLTPDTHTLEFTPLSTDDSTIDGNTTDLVDDSDTELEGDPVHIERPKEVVAAPLIADAVLADALPIDPLPAASILPDVVTAVLTPVEPVVMVPAPEDPGTVDLVPTMPGDESAADIAVEDEPAAIAPQLAELQPTKPATIEVQVADVELEGPPVLQRRLSPEDRRRLIAQFDDEEGEDTSGYHTLARSRSVGTEVRTIKTLFGGPVESESPFTPIVPRRGVKGRNQASDERFIRNRNSAMEYLVLNCGLSLAEVLALRQKDLTLNPHLSGAKKDSLTISYGSGSTQYRPERDWKGGLGSYIEVIRGPNGVPDAARHPEAPFLLSLCGSGVSGPIVDAPSELITLRNQLANSVWRDTRCSLMLLCSMKVRELRAADLSPADRKLIERYLELAKDAGQMFRIPPGGKDLGSALAFPAFDGRILLLDL